MLPRATVLALTSGDAAVETAREGDVVRGRRDLRCRTCGYGASVVRSVPRCPMCGAHAWEAPTPAPRRSTVI